MTSRRTPAAWTAALMLSALAASFSSASRADTLRVCADPDNLPFTKADGPEKGLYVELAELVAKKLNSQVEYTWWYTHNQRRALRNTILKDECDAVFLPADSDYKVRGLQRTKPFIDVSYAMVTREPLALSRLEDLKGRKVGVQFRSTPQLVLANDGGYTTTTYLKAEELFEALGKGEIEVALMWGPSAGYDNKRQHGSRYVVTPLVGRSFDGQMAVAVRRDKDGLAERVDRALNELQGEIRGLALKYGFPVSEPIKINALAASRNTAAVYMDSEARPGSGIGWNGGEHAVTGFEGWRVVKVAAPAKGDVAAGKAIINGDCSHCHGAGGMSPVVERDMRRMKRRYEANWEEVAAKTIREGRVQAGMPTMGGMKLSDDDISNIVAYLRTIQRD